jgi:hypothetical protein
MKIFPASATIILLLAVHCEVHSKPPSSDNANANITINSFVSVPRHHDSRLRFTKPDAADDERIHCDITSPRGIDRAVIHRKTAKWPNHMVLRLHFKGLESLKITSQQTTVQWSVPSAGDHESRMSRIIDGQEVEVDKGDPLYGRVVIVGFDTIPLTTGYFTVEIPAALFVNNPESIKCEWIDFYRN